MKSFKTSILGAILALGAFLTNNPELFAYAEAIGNILTPIAALLMGISARDNDVSSEVAGAK